MHQGVYIAPDVDRAFIMSRIEVVNGCWEWQGALNSKGYGHIFRTSNGVRVWPKVHRIAYALWKGPCGDLHVLHRCDNPKCCNPDHLFLGTSAENMADMASKGRAKGWPGHTNPNAKLSADQVKRIASTPRRGHPGGMSDEDLAGKYGVDRATIMRHRRGVARVRSKLTYEQIVAIAATPRKPAPGGLSDRELAARYGVNHSTIHHYRRHGTGRFEQESAA